MEMNEIFPTALNKLVEGTNIVLEWINVQK